MTTITRLLAQLVLAFAILIVGYVSIGCQTRLDPAGPYAGNTALYATDSAVTAAFGVLDVFMAFQYANRATLPADVNAFADRTRRDAPQWAKSIIALRDIYAAAPTPANKSALDKVLRLLREATTQAAVYIVPKS